MAGQDVTRVAAKHRGRLASREARTVARLSDLYTHVLTQLDGDWRLLARRIDETRAAGRPVSAAWLRRESRYRQLIAATRTELARVVPAAADAASALAREAAIAALADTAEIAALADTTAARAARAATHIAGLTDRGALADLLASRTTTTVDAVGKVLTRSVTEGWTEARTARELERAAGGSFRNARVVARTEQRRAYRETTRQAFLADPAVTGWQWRARCTHRTCGMCWAQHGTIHPLNEPMATHPMCQCEMVPVTEGRSPSIRTSGPDRFARLTGPQQDAILGGAKAAAYRDGKLTLPDLVSTTKDPAWGWTGTERSLTSVLGADAAPYIRAARTAP